MIHEPSIRPGESVSGLDKWIASKLWRANARDDVVSVDDLREFMKGKVLVDAAKVELLLDILRGYEWFDQAEDEAFAHLEQALQHPASSGVKGNG